MSRERVQQVWLPAAGVYAALPEPPKPGSSAGAPVFGSQRRKARSCDGTEMAPADQKPLRASPPAKRQRSDRDDENRRQTEEQRGREGGAAAAFTGFDLRCSDAESSDVGELEPAPTCPICLVDVVELADKAVVTPCMHEFCEPCISRWLGHHKRVCPLCKARVGSVLYDITPSGNHKERVVPPSPELAVIGSGDGGGGGDGALLLQHLQDFLGVAGLMDSSHHSQQQQQQRRRRRGQQQGQQPAAGPVRLRTESGSGRSGRPGAAPSTALTAAAPPPAGPRPYFWRLQQRLQAGGYRPGAPLGGVAAAAGEQGAVMGEDYVLLWRRQVYDQDLWAEPLGAEASRLALGTGSSRERRLTEWTERELRALLQTDDVTILRGFVMGLVAAYGTEPLHSGGGGGAATGAAGGTAGGASYSSEAAARRAAALASSRAAGMVAAAAARRDSQGPDGGGGGGGGGALSSSPEEALRPFLYEHSAHFWHELRCFATAPPYTLATYDRMVRYRRREAAPTPPPAAAAAAAAPPPAVLRPNAPLWQGQQRRRVGGAGGPGSRWDQGRPGQPPAAVAQELAGLRDEAVGLLRRVEAARLVARGRGAAGVQQGAAAVDASVPRLPRRRSRSRSSRSRNPSPPPSGHAAGKPAGQQEAWLLRDGGRQRSRPSRRRRSRGRSRSRARGERGRSRRRSRSRSLRGRRRHRSRGRSASRGGEQQRDRPEVRERCSPGRYLAGADDGGDRWGM